MLPSSAGHHAWLFQYNADDNAQWLKGDPIAQIPWRIRRWANETRQHDPVFFWETGPRGGLRGFGYVEKPPYEETDEKGRRRWRVPVRVVVWRDAPVPRQEVLRAGAFDRNNLFLRMPEGSNFRLDPGEAQALIELIPEAGGARLEGLIPHGGLGNRQEAQVAAAVRRLGRIPPLSLWAAKAVTYGSLREQGIRGEVSTTRLLLGLLTAAQECASLGGIGDDERAVLIALDDVAQRHQRLLLELRAGYIAEHDDDPGPEAIELTANAEQVLRTAAAHANTFSGELTADLLLAGLMASAEGAFIDRLRSRLPIAQLKAELLEAIALIRKDLVPRWQEMLGITPAEPPAPEPQPRSEEPVPPEEPARPIGTREVADDDAYSMAGVGNDNAWQANIDDCLGATDEAIAFASVALSPSMVPPMAIGVFGEWGSGKSFFMRLVHKHIEEMARRAEDAATNDRFLRNVVQIRFNAWHYVDTNLWASLVDHIFTELDKAIGEGRQSRAEALFAQLATARELTLESAEHLVRMRKEQQEAARALASSERDLLATRKALLQSPRTFWEAARAQLRSADAPEREAIDDAVRTLGFDKAYKEAGAMSRAIHALADEGANAGTWLTGLRTQFGSWPKVIFLFAFTAAMYFGLRAFFAWFSQAHELARFLNETAVAAAATFALITPVFVQAARRVRQAVATVERFRGHLTEAVEAASRNPLAAYQASREELARKTAEVDQGRAQLAATTERATEAAREYNAGTGRARLLEFVRQKASGETYRSHLGLVSTIRKDFDELSSAMGAGRAEGAVSQEERKRDEQAYGARVQALVGKGTDGASWLSEDEIAKLQQTAQVRRPDDARVVDRIVLYIDDLDRCQPERVAEVLQAVHLLLSFQLFVVFVAVDVRWVSRALEKHYPMLLDRRGPNGNGRREQVATAHDYLEKIFQVPYWVRPMSPEDGTRFMSARLRRLDLDAAATRGAAGPAPQDRVLLLDGGDSAARAASATLDGGDAASEPDRILDLGDSGLSGGLADADGESAGSNADAAQPAVMRARRLELTQAEKKFVEALGVHAGSSPRRAIRFLNVYQIIKTSVKSAKEKELLDQGGFHYLMTQIAILTGAPELVAPWSEYLRQAAADARRPAASVKDIAMRVTGQPWYKRSEQRSALTGALAVLLQAQPQAPTSRLLHYADLAKRYSFTG